MNATLKEVVDAGRDVLKITFVQPVREGRPRPDGWPPGLRQIAASAIAVLAMLTLGTLGSGLLRGQDTLSLSPTDLNVTLPSLSLPVLLLGVVVALALAATAALHAAWWLRLGVLILTAVAIVTANPMALTTPTGMLLVGGSFLILVGFTIARSFRTYAWWEYVVVLCLVGAALILPLGVPSALSIGWDSRPATVSVALSMLGILVVPAVMVAGFAPAQIVVTAADAVANRPVSRGLFWSVFAIALCAFAATSWQHLTADPRPSWPAVVASSCLLAAVALVAGVLLRRARASRPPDPHQYPEAWGNWIYPLAAAMAGIIVVSWVAVAITVLLTLSGANQAAAAVLAANQAVFTGGSGTIWRAVVGAGALVASWRLSRRDRLVEAIMLATFGTFMGFDALGLAPGLSLLHQRSAAMIGLVCVTIALASMLVHILRRRFDRDRAAGVLTVLMLALLYPHRDALSDPISALLWVAPTAMLLFGLGWRMFTEATITYSSSVRYPQSSRVLLFLANSVLAATGIAFVSLSRGMGTDSDLSDWGQLGDLALGEPLYLAGLVTGLWLMLRPRVSGEVSEQLTDERYDSEEVAAEEAAEEAAEPEYGPWTVMPPTWPPNAPPPPSAPPPPA